MRLFDTILDYILAWRDQRRRRRWLQFQDEAQTKANAGSLADNEMVYAAHARCACGAGMAYPRNIGPFGFWDCSDILTGRAIPKGQPGSKLHEGKLPFTFYEIKSEQQPSANGATTRPPTQTF